MNTALRRVRNSMVFLETCTSLKRHVNKMTAVGVKITGDLMKKRTKADSSYQKRPPGGGC
jgi:hypothetical protein